jgi:hypothetical protein
MAKLKNLATCTPREFMRQTAKIRRAAKKWLTLTEIMNIRKRLPTYDKDATEEEKETALQEQSIQNVNAILDAVLEKYPDETIDLLGLCCFLEPEEVDNHSTEELLAAMNDMIGSEAVLGFFTSLAKLGQTGILNV